MNDIIIQEVQCRDDLKEFIHFPEKIHKDHVNWVPPVYRDEWDYFSPAKNRAFLYCDTVSVLARRNGLTAGRIMGIINHRYNEEKNEKSARFSFFECINDASVSGELLGYVEKWASGKGMTKIIGPFGMCYHDPIGFMTEGFKERPSLTANYNFEYIIKLIEASGYATEADLVVYKIDLCNDMPPGYLDIYDKILQNPKIRLLNFTSRKQLRRYIHPVLV